MSFFLTCLSVLSPTARRQVLFAVAEDPSYQGRFVAAVQKKMAALQSQSNVFISEIASNERASTDQLLKQLDKS